MILWVIFEGFAEQLAEGEACTAALAESWHYTSPLMAVPEVWQRLDYLADELVVLLREGAESEDIMPLLEAFCKAAPYDVSGEMLACRRLSRDLLSESADERLREAAERIEELSQRMGGNHVMARTGAWMKHKLPLSREAQGNWDKYYLSFGRAKLSAVGTYFMYVRNTMAQKHFRTYIK